MSESTREWLLRVYLGEDDLWHSRPLYEALVLKARELHLAGATVLRGPMGFGARSLLHTAKVLRLSQDLPVVVEIVDRREKIDQLLPYVEMMVGESLVTLEEVEPSAVRAPIPTHIRPRDPPAGHRAPPEGRPVPLLFAVRRSA
jgi:PII-like signaling protein